jgi:hypothetical protein
MNYEPQPKEKLMRTRPYLALLIAGTLSGTALIAAQAAGPKTGARTAAVPVAELTEAVEHDLLFMREEEKVARDVYAGLYAEWGVRVFNNIAQSEQQHMDSILGLLNQYGLVDPALEAGQFSNTDLQDLFDALMSRGRQSKLEALMVGALIEEVDIEDLAQAMLRTDQSGILSVYINLMKGSENHLNAFVKNIEAITGVPYTAQQITQKEVDAILNR